MFYDVAYDRSLAPLSTTQVMAPRAAPVRPACSMGRRQSTEEGIDINQALLNGGGKGDGDVSSIDPTKLPRDPANNCDPVYPWNFVRTNTIFGVIHQAGGYTAWSDKHPAYSSVSGPTTSGPSTWHKTWMTTTLRKSTRSLRHCRAFRVAVGSGGYTDAIGTPTPLMLKQIEFVDSAIGKFVSELENQHVYGSTLIVITAKHGQSPVDTQRYNGDKTSPVTTSPSKIGDSCLPDSESNAGGQIGPTEDDVSLLWLTKCTAEDAVDTLEKTSPASSNIAGIGQIFWGPGIRQLFNAPGMPPDADPRTPDIIVTPNVGVTYSGSTAKHAEHGGLRMTT